MKAPRKAQVLLFYVVPFIFIPKLIYYNKSLFVKKSSYLTSECQIMTNLSLQVLHMTSGSTENVKILKSQLINLKRSQKLTEKPEKS